MKIKYKEPYWVKFQWDLDEHHDNQYVTNFDKSENRAFNYFLHKEDYIITCNFKIKKHYKKDDISMVFGKPGKNLGLSFNNDTNQLCFEFWTKGDKNKEDVYNNLLLKTVSLKEIESGITISIVRKGNEFFSYKNFEYDNETLKQEYDRDVANGTPINVPANYYPDDDPTQRPRNRWRSHAHLLYGNWVNELYQTTWFDLSKIGS